jgi:hypothetical protein
VNQLAPGVDRPHLEPDVHGYDDARRFGDLHADYQEYGFTPIDVPFVAPATRPAFLAASFGR